MTTNPDASAAHPAHEREYSAHDLAAAQGGFVVVDNYNVQWTKNDDGLGRWVSIIEPAPGLTHDDLVAVCGPIRRSRRQPNLEGTPGTP